MLKIIVTTYLFVTARTERALQRWSVPLPCTPSLRHASACADGGWVLKLGIQRSDPGRGLGLAAWKQPKGARVWCDHT